jgi:hypothetical protein
MFEVIICTVSTGRVVRRLFDTRAEADRYVTQREKKVLCDSGTLRRHRFEVRYREDLTLRPITVALPVQVPEPAAA